MAATPPPSISPSPPVPNRSDRATFSDRVDAFVTWMSNAVTQFANVATNVYNNALDAFSSAESANISKIDAQQAVVDAGTAGADQVALAAAQVELATTQAGNAATSAGNAADSASEAANSAALAGAAAGFDFTGGAGKFPQVNPSETGFQLVPLIIPAPSIPRVARTSNTVLVTADTGKWFDMSGTFTQTFAAAASLAANWFCYVKNSGSGVIALDPNSSETIDGATTLVIYPGQARIVQCDGTAFRTILISGSATMIVVDEKPTGTAGGDITAQAFVTRALNTVRALSIPGASLSANSVTLPAGTYQVYGRAPAYQVGRHQIRLFNVTASASILYGTSQSQAGAGNNSSEILGQFTLESQSSVRIEHWVESTAAGTNSLGMATTVLISGATPAGAIEVYSQMTLTKVA